MVHLMARNRGSQYFLLLLALRLGPGFCLQDLLNLKLHERAADVSEIVVLAQKEARIDKKLAEITSTWEKKSLEFSSEREDTPLLLPLDEVVEVLEQHSVDLMTMISQGAVIDFCRSSVEEWQLKLRTVDTVLTVWMEVQRKWEASLAAYNSAPEQTRCILKL